MIAPVLHARPLIAPTTRMPTAIPASQLRRVQRELDLCRRLMHASRKAASRSERDCTSTTLFPTRGGGTARGAPQTGHFSTERRRALRIPGVRR